MLPTGCGSTRVCTEGYLVAAVVLTEHCHHVRVRTVLSSTRILSSYGL